MIKKSVVKVTAYAARRRVDAAAARVDAAAARVDSPLGKTRQILMAKDVMYLLNNSGRLR